MNLILSILIGSGLGAALGYYGKCTSGTCPLTANWRRGALYGAFLGVLFHGLSGGNRFSTSEPTPNVKLIQQEQFEAEVAQTDGPVVVDFFATWCGPCRRLGPMLDGLAEPLTNRVTFLKVDVDRSPKLAARFQIEGVPTLIFFSHGKVVDKIVGLPSKELLQAKLESMASSTGSTSGGQ